MSLVRYAGSEEKKGDRCRRGHPRTEANTYWASHGGKRWRVCKQCRALSQRVIYNHQKEKRNG